MNYLHDFVTNVLFVLPPLTRDILIFLFSYAEGLPIIGTIVPGGTIALLIGTLTRDNFISPIVAINLIAIGSFLGDITGFLLGKHIRKIRWVRTMMENQKHQKHWDAFDRHIALVVIFGKLLPVIRSTPSLFAGARNISKWKYMIYVAIGSYLWAFVGIYGGSALAKILGTAAIPLIIGVLVMTTVTTWFITKRTRQRGFIEKESTETNVIE